MGMLKRYERIPVNEIIIYEDSSEEGEESLLSEEILEQKEQNIQKLINECTKFAFEIEEQLTVRSDNPTQWLRAKLWFEAKMKILKYNWWKLRSEEVDLSIVGQFLITFLEESMIWKSLAKGSKEKLLKWQEVANLATMEIIQLRKQTEPGPTKGRNIFNRSLTTCMNIFFLCAKYELPES